MPEEQGRASASTCSTPTTTTTRRTDAFTRHLEPEMRQARHAVGRGRRQAAAAWSPGKINRFIPNPPFDPVARPGVPRRLLPGPAPADDIRGAFGELEPISPSTASRTPALKVMDEQGIEACFLFPTLGVGMEEALLPRPRGRPRRVPRVQPLARRRLGPRLPRAASSARRTSRCSTPTRRSPRLDWAVAHGARSIVMRAGPVMAPDRRPLAGRPGLRPVLGAARRGRHHRRLPLGRVRLRPLRRSTGASRPSSRRSATTPLYGIITSAPADLRHDGGAHLPRRVRPLPDLRVATIESGSEWVPPAGQEAGEVVRSAPGAFAGATRSRRCAATSGSAPYYEDDIRGLADAIGADHVLFGSDWPHAEGLADPPSFVEDLDGLHDDEVRLIMRDNGLALAQRI